MLTVGSLFSGIGGLDLGLERAGMQVKWQVEIDPYCRKVLAKHWPGVVCYEDVTTLDYSKVEAVDLICGGFPCQDLSHAGKRTGLKGERSGLFYEVIRAVCELRPRYVLLENVPGLLTLGMGDVLGALAEVGYDVEWQVLSAAQFGAPHLRERVFIIAYPTGGGFNYRPISGGCPAQKQYANKRGQGKVTAYSKGDVGYPQRCGCSPQSIESAGAVLGEGSETFTGASVQPDVADADGKRRLVFGVQPGNGTGVNRKGNGGCAGPTSGNGDSGGEWWRVEPDVGRVADGVPARVDRLRCLGNAVVPQVAEWIGQQIVKHAGDYET